MNSSTLRLFTDAHILQQVGRPLLIEFLEHFSHLLPYKHFLPSPRADNDEYFDCLAVVLERTGELPGGLAEALIQVEALAASGSRRGGPAALGDDSADAEDSSLSEAIRGWLRSHAAEVPSSDGRFTETMAAAAPPAESACIEGLPDEPPRRCSANGLISPSLSSTRLRGASARQGGGEGEDPLGVSEVQRFEAPILSRKSPSDPETPNPELRGVEADPDQQAFECLARLSPAQYDRARRAEARRLHLRIQTLDSEVAKIRSELDIEAQANAVKLPAIEPWPEPVDGPELLDQASSRYTLYLVLPSGAADAFALWGGHCHAVAAFYLTPRLNLLSPKEGCGKTTALDVLTTMVPRPLRTENISAPVLFRLVDQHQPILLLDEVDAYLPQAEELRGLLNAGHKRGACAYRCEGDGKAVRAFNAFAPAALAGIGSLPATLRDRSILIPLVAAEEGQILTRFDPMHIEIETVLARKYARWAKDNFRRAGCLQSAFAPGSVQPSG